MIDIDQLDILPTKSALRRRKRREKRAYHELRLANYRQSFAGRKAAREREQASVAFRAQEERRLELLRRRTLAMASALAVSVVNFEVEFGSYLTTDLNRARAYMLGETHRCMPLPLELSVAVGDYRRDLLARRLQIEPFITEINALTSVQYNEVLDALVGHFEELMEVSDGLYNCSVWHPLCKNTNDHARSRRISRRSATRKWQRNVLKVYINITGLSAVEDLFSYALIPQPRWLRQIIAQSKTVRLIA